MFNISPFTVSGTVYSHPYYGDNDTANMSAETRATFFEWVRRICAARVFEIMDM